MKFVTSLSVQRTHGESNAFWPRGLKRLVVLVSSVDLRDDRLVAYGIDPAQRQIVFHAELPHSRHSAFIKAVIDGDAAVIDHHRHTAADGAPGDETALQAIVVFAYRDPADPGPRLAVALAAAIRSQETLGEAVANRPPPHPPGKGGC